MATIDPYEVRFSQDSIRAVFRDGGTIRLTHETIMPAAPLDLADQVELIRSREDLAKFVRDLVADLQTNPGDWESVKLETYLEALAAWVEDMDGYFQNRKEVTPTEPSWRLLGEILLAAKVYE